MLRRSRSLSRLRQHGWRVPLAGAIAASVAALAGLFWLARPRPDAGPASPVAAIVGAASPATDSSVILPVVPIVRAPTGESGVPSEREAVEHAALVQPVRVHVKQKQPEVDLLAHFSAPDGKGLVVPFATIALVDGAGNHRAIAARGASSVTIAGLAQGAHTVDVQAHGFVHRTQVFEIQAKARFSSGRVGPGASLAAPEEQRIVLWPEGWIPVVVRTPDGRPLRQLALDLRIEPKRLFVGAFDVLTRESPPDSGASEDGPAPATFVPPPGYQSWELPDGAIGTLRLRSEPPFWAGLTVLGKAIGWQLVRPGDVEVGFELDLEGFDAHCARLRLRVIDGLTKAPLPDAEVTLRADTSAHRREDQREVAPDGDGVVELQRILPGRYELTVERGESQHQERLTLQAGEARDIGDVALAQGPGIELLVLDERGEPAQAYIEIAPHGPGKRVDALYPPMLQRRSGADGRYLLARPAVRSIVRARFEVSTSMGHPSRGARTENVLIDPEALPASPLVLRLRDPVAVRFELASSQRVEVADDLGVVVAWVEPPSEPRPRWHGHWTHTLGVAGQPVRVGAPLGETRELLPGHYTARFLDEAGEASGQTAFVVGAMPMLVRGP